MAKKNETSKTVATKAAKILSDPKASEDVKSVAASALKQAPKKAVKPAAYLPLLGEIALFTSGDSEFLGEIASFDPLEVVEHLLINNCHATLPKEADSLDGFIISPLSRSEVVELLY